MHPTFEYTLAAPSEAKLLVGLCDWRLFLPFAKARTSRQVFDTLNEFYALTERAIEPAGGLVVKFMGDAALVVFPEELADAGIMALLDFKHETDRWFKTQRINSSLHVNAHFTEITIGRMGRDGRLDVAGEGVNVTATMGRADFALSQQAFRCLTPEHRRLFQRFTPPILYLPAKMEA
ncbi:MAG TPA: hypothetical protein VKU60_20630 [Chloroflexota bacterium]|nr:hypothetical protein [Chloroflexota bacterium]